MSLRRMAVAGAAVAVLAGSTIIAIEQAEARPFGGGFRGGGFRGGPGFGGGFRGGPGFAGGYRGGYYGRRGWGPGLGIGLASGLALGAVAAGAYPYYGGYGYYGGGYAPAYYGGYGGCYFQPRRVWGPYGPYVARVRVCY